MTSAERGREAVKIADKGEGVKNPENLADVICEWPPVRLRSARTHKCKIAFRNIRCALRNFRLNAKC